jgi:hypothetical protein
MLAVLRATRLNEGDEMQGLNPGFSLTLKNFEPVFYCGFILCDPTRLDQFCDGQSQETDLLARFQETGEWLELYHQGILVCIPDVEYAEYTVVVRHYQAESKLVGAPTLVSKGWILGTETGHLIISNLNNLMFWEVGNEEKEDLNNYNRQKEFRVNPGWYKVTIQGGINFPGTEDEEWIFEFLLESAENHPSFSVDLSKLNGSLRPRDLEENASSEMPISKILQESPLKEITFDKELMLSLLSRLNLTAFKHFIMKHFDDTDEHLTDFDEMPNGFFRQRILDSYGESLDSGFLIHYLPLQNIRDPRKVDVIKDPSLANGVIKIRDYYKGKCGYYGMVSESMVKAAKLRSLAILTNLAGLDKDYYQSRLIPRYSDLARIQGLFVSSLLVGSYDSFIDLDADKTYKSFRNFLNSNSDGITILLNESTAHISRFGYETSLDGVLENSRRPLEPVFVDLQHRQERILSEFQSLIHSETPEDALEEFLAEHFQDIFGSNYDQIETQVWLRFPDLDIANKDRRMDIFLRDGVINDWAIFEIKRVIPLTRSYRDIPVITSEITYAVQQVKNYSRILGQDTVKRRFAAQGIDYFEPTLNLVVGKTPQIPHGQWRWLVSSYERDVKIITFDNLLEQMKRRTDDRLRFLKSEPE